MGLRKKRVIRTHLLLNNGNKYGDCCGPLLVSENINLPAHTGQGPSYKGQQDGGAHQQTPKCYSGFSKHSYLSNASDILTKPRVSCLASCDLGVLRYFIVLSLSCYASHIPHITIYFLLEPFIAQRCGLPLVYYTNNNNSNKNSTCSQSIHQSRNWWFCRQMLVS